MKRSIVWLAVAATALVVQGGCSADDKASMDGSLSGPSFSSGEGESNGSSDKGENDQPEPGVITAGEWNDLENWEFWEELLENQDYDKMPDYWSFHTGNRVAVDVATDEGRMVANALVVVKSGETPLATARTNNKGRAELWLALYQKDDRIDFAALSLEVDGEASAVAVRPFGEGVCEVTVEEAGSVENAIQIAFMVDATGSMSDEMEYLKTELVDVVNRVKNSNAGSSVVTSAVFYRDEGDDYVTRVSNFTSDLDDTNDFINDQSADGGGDTPEAVHTAFEKSLSELQWSDGARTKILFMLLDAPPHYETFIVNSLHESVTEAMERGIRVIPIAASGVDKETEFLLRMMAMATNGTYVFITDDSGVGNPHLAPSVGQYEVELLNDLMVRLINEFSE